ncbi:hypothetical protein [Hymenobacter elongatus]|uniref:Uncharacterized protein n=1 Tax=Hymenobacter elongatus TaxID=877208 RepID=A0A4Z0PG66_9BACT|nr:hypothetical protein [Hymenobacter elongatus]TGE14005.1 hypothetical protein E5J99_17960 [Hymenobacter elongatus]
MKEQDASPTIRKDLVLPIGLDYARLRAEGISMLQNLSGSVWTDYNEHDPGVTILEALCYALTDLTNRASQPIASLLAPPPGTAPPPGSTLVPAHQAFSNHPVTLHDYKKIVLDQEHLSNRVQSVWVEPRRGPAALAGEYTVRIGLRSNHQLPELRRAAQQQGRDEPSYLPADHHQLAHDILHTLNKHRGLGEQFVEVIFLEPYIISVGGHFEIKENQLHETVLADVLWHIDRFFEPTITTRGLGYLQATHVPSEEIFAGPLLENQLLQESEFEPQLTLIAPARVNSLLATLDSIKSVGELHLYEPNCLVPSALIRVPPERELVFDVAASLNRFTASHRGVALKFNRTQTLHKFEQLHADRTRSLRSPIPKSKLRFAEAPARHLELGQYDSIQHSFPAIYGLGEGGLPAGASPAQRAQSLQLKGYLLFFEQIMANFCAQLDNVETLLSARHQQQGFFAQPLSDVPGLHQVLHDLEYEQTEAALEDADFEANANASPQATTGSPGETDDSGLPLSRHYLRKLGKLAEDPSEFLQRRDTLLGHLLARFGYSVSVYQPTLTDPADIRQHRIRVRERLLQNLNTATYHRGAARVAPDDDTPDVSGLELFVYLLTGIKYFQLVLTLGEQLSALEAEVQLDGAAGSTAHRLRVHGAPLSFPDFLGLLHRQLATPTLELLTTEPPRAAVPAYPGVPRLELELHPGAAAAPADAEASAQHQILAYLHQLDERLNRFILLDHRTLKPAGYDPAAAPLPDAPDRTFYEFQVSICLPDFTRQFRQTANSQYGGATYVYREYVQNLIHTHAPAHLLVHIIWLDYPQMKELEVLYIGFVKASGLLANHDGHDQPDLPQWQQQLTRFLLPHLSS